MPCDTPVRPQQTLAERKAEIVKTISNLDKLLLRRRVRVVVGKQGAIAFTGWTNDDRAGVTDACAYRRLMATGSAIAKAEIMRAEALAGRPVDRSVVAAGVHSHDGGRTWSRD